ncbi:hypothetical protein GCM10007394_04400 [Salinibacterium amurskyense]|nr:hypothetical protein GCM10007394_04400 [Salinibacterium amurskyense]
MASSNNLTSPDSTSEIAIADSPRDQLLFLRKPTQLIDQFAHIHHDDSIVPDSPAESAKAASVD